MASRTMHDDDHGDNDDKDNDDGDDNDSDDDGDGVRCVGKKGLVTGRLIRISRHSHSPLQPSFSIIFMMMSMLLMMGMIMFH